MLRKSGYIFTNRKYSEKGIMSTILGAISAVSIVVAIYFTFKNHGEALLRYGSTMLLTTIFSIVGLVMGISSRMEPDKYYLFSYIGIVMNTLVLAGTGFILFAGVYGL